MGSEILIKLFSVQNKYKYKRKDLFLQLKILEKHNKFDLYALKHDYKKYPSNDSKSSFKH